MTNIGPLSAKGIKRVETEAERLALPTPFLDLVFEADNDTLYVWVEDTETWEVLSTPGAVVNHDDLANIQGGIPSEHYHLTADQVDLVDDVVNKMDLDGTNSDIEYLQFNLTPTVDHAEGRVHWDEENGTVCIGMQGGSVKLQVGQETLIRARCKEAGGILDGQVVYISGSTGDRPEVMLANADNYNKSFVLGIATENIPFNQSGFVCMEGIINDIPTNISGATEGCPIWLSTTAGEFTCTQPPAPNMNVFLGYIIRVSATEGRIAIRPTLIPRLQALSDVNGTPLETSGQIMVWDNDNKYFDADFNINDYETLLNTGAWKSHRIDSYTFPNTNWQDIYFDLKIEDECYGDIHYLNEGEVNEDTSILVINGYNDIFKVAGCLHTLYNGAPGTSITFACRCLISYDEGDTWIEARCLQVLDREDRGTSAEGTVLYNGTIRTYGDTAYLKLQARTSNIAISLQGDAWFDNPVSATIHLSTSNIRYE